uniref:Uncharacterized protein n=1 Tax=Nelumbo nucifera TaxID=4432 RepID=A0A822Z325_NELNU|nr:TPA_asm: hypothetical protein HUJ06_013413 [Nelumbo nucifera]
MPPFLGVIKDYTASVVDDCSARFKCFFWRKLSLDFEVEETRVMGLGKTK